MRAHDDSVETEVDVHIRTTYYHTFTFPTDCLLCDVAAGHAGIQHGGAHILHVLRHKASTDYYDRFPNYSTRP